MASFCAYPAWYIFPRWRRPRAPLGPPRGGGGVQYIGAVSSCSPLIPIRSCCPLLLSPCFLFLYAFPCVSLVVSPLVSSCVSSHASRCVVPSIVPSCLFVMSFRFAPFRFAVRSFSSCSSWRDCLAFPVSLRFALPSRLSLRPVGSARLGRFVSARYLVRSCPCAARVRSYAWFPCSCRFVLLVARSYSLSAPPGSSCSRLRRGVGRGVMSHGRRFALVGSSVPSLLLFATRSLVA